MKITLSGPLVGCLFVLGMFSLAPRLALASESYSPRVGQVHADFTLPNIEHRKAVSLADFRGKKVLLIHFASW